jgi:hypothetical protein
MSRFPFKLAAPASLIALVGCMQPPMYQQNPYGQQMYAPQGNFAAPGTFVVPQSNAPPYQPLDSTYGTPTTPNSTTPNSTTPTDSFGKPLNSGDTRFFTPDGEVPPPKDPASGADSTRPFDNDFKLEN